MRSMSIFFQIFLAGVVHPYCPLAFCAVDDAHTGLEAVRSVGESAFSWTRVTPESTWPARSSHAATVFQEKIWLTGGTNDAFQRLNDIWSSPDGVDWTLVTSNAPWPARSGHQMLVFGGKLWIAGGSHLEHYDDIWNSTNGIEWENIVPVAP